MITVYTYPECPYCRELKELYDKEKIEYKDVNINLPENYAEFGKIMVENKIEEVPVIIINNKILLPNIDFHTIPEAVELTKKMID